jgi:hypothetical protein
LRILFVPTLVILLAQGPAFADGQTGARSKASPVPSKKSTIRTRAGKAIAFTPEREAAALTFVRAHHPELASLLERLRPMNQGEYEQAIIDLFQISESLADLKQRDPNRYELGLEAWKARSRVELLTAQLASAPGPELESQLRQAVASQLDVELRQHRFDLEQARGRVLKIQDVVDRLESRHDALIESRVQGLLKKSRNARRPEAAPRARSAARSSPTPRKNRP